MPWTFPAGSIVDEEYQEVLTLRVHVPNFEITKTLRFKPQMTIQEVCDRIRHQISDLHQNDKSSPNDYGIFHTGEDDKKGLWLNNSRNLEHYMLRSGDTIQYRYRYRWLYIKTLDGNRKKLCVDDSKTVAELMFGICMKIGIQNYEEYALVRDQPIENDYPEPRHSTLRKSQPSMGTDSRFSTGTLLRDHQQEKMDRLKKKLHTDDDVNWLNPAQSLRQQGIDETEVLILRRRYFFSDMNVDARDPVQLNLLYLQLRDAILNGTHPITQDEALLLAGLQIQVDFGNNYYQGNLDMIECLPKEYAKIKNIEKKVMQYHANCYDVSEIDAKMKYCQFCRSLQTYGITFFLVKEKVKGKNKLIPRLLGVSKDSVIRLDERTKEILKIWPLTSVYKWAASPNAFTMDFGEYSPDEYYTAQTNEGEHISQLIAGYIDILLKRQKAKDEPGLPADEESAIFIETVACEQAEVVPSSQVRLRQPSGDHIRYAINGTQQTTNGHHLPSRHVIDDGINEALLVGTEQHTSTARQYNLSQQKYDYMDTNYPIDYQNQHQYSTSVSSKYRQQSPDSFMTGGTQYIRYKEIKQARKDLLNTINENLRVIETQKKKLDIGEPVRVYPLLSNDKNSLRWLEDNIADRHTRVKDEIGAMNAAVAQTLRSTTATRKLNPPEIIIDEVGGLRDTGDDGEDLIMMQQSFRVITVQFPALVDDVRQMALLKRETDQIDQSINIQQEASNERMLDATKNVADRFSELLTSAKPFATLSSPERITIEDEESRRIARQAIVAAANKVGDASKDLLSQVNLYDRSRSNGHYINQDDVEYRLQLDKSTKNMANLTAVLVTKSKELGESLDREEQFRVISVATDIATAAKQLHDCNELLGYTISQQSCQEQMSQASYHVSETINKLLIVTKENAENVHIALQNQMLREEDAKYTHDCIKSTEQAAEAVIQSLDVLNAQINSACLTSYKPDLLNQFEIAYQRMLVERDPVRFQTASREVVEFTAQSIQKLSDEAKKYEKRDPERQERLLQFAKKLTQTLSETVNLIKELPNAGSNDVQIRNGILNHAEILREDLNASNVELFGDELLHNLIYPARASLSASNQLNNAIKTTDHMARSTTSTIISDSKNVDEVVTRLAIALQKTKSNPEGSLELLELFQACERFLLPAERLVDSSRSMQLTLSDPGLQSIVQIYSDNSQSTLAALRSCLRRAELWVIQRQVSNSLLKLESLRREAEELRDWIPPPQTVDSGKYLVSNANHLLFDAVRQGFSASNHLKSDYVQKLPEATCDNWAGQSAGELVLSMSNLLEATLTFKSDAYNNQANKFVLNPQTIDQLNSDVIQTINLAHQLLLKAKDSDLQNLDAVSNEFQNSLSNCLTVLPGQRELAYAATEIIRHRNEVEYITRLANERQLPPAKIISVDEMRVLQQTVSTAARGYHQATSDLMIAESGHAVADAAVRFSDGAYELFNASQKLCQCVVQGTPEQIMMPDGLNREAADSLLDVADFSLRFLNEARDICGHPSGRPLRDGLHQRGRAIQESITRLLLINDSSLNPALLACEDSIQQLSAMQQILDFPKRPFTNNSYYGCIFESSNIIKNLNEGIKGMSKARGQADYCRSVKTFTESICNFMEETAQAAYLVGINDVRSEPGKPATLSYDVLIKLQMEINQYCAQISSQDISNRQDLAALIEVSENALAKLSVLENLVSDIASKADSTNARKQLLDQMDRLYSTMSVLTHGSADWTANGQNTTDVTAQRAISELNELVQIVTSSGHFGGQIGTIAEPAKELQKPICEAGKSTLDAAKSLLQNSKNLPPVAFGNRQTEPDHETLRAFTEHSAQVCISIKALLNAMEDFAPGKAECKIILNKINSIYLPDLQQARNSIMQETLPPCIENNEDFYQKHLMNIVRTIRDSVPKLAQYARCESERIGYSVIALDEQLESLSKKTIDAAASSHTCSSQLAYIEFARSVLQETERFIEACRQSGGNPNAVEAHQLIHDARNRVIIACDDYLQALAEISDRQNQINNLVVSIAHSRSQINEYVKPPRLENLQKNGTATISVRTNHQYSTRLLRLADKMQQQTQDILIRARERDSGHRLLSMARTLTDHYKEMIPLTHSTAETLESSQDSQQLIDLMMEVGISTSQLVKATGGGGIGTRDSSSAANDVMIKTNGTEYLSTDSAAHFGLRDLDNHGAQLDLHLKDLIDFLISKANAGSQAYTQAASTVSAIIADLDTNILFASSGTMHAPLRDDYDAQLLEYNRSHMKQYSETRDSITRAAKAIVDDTRSLVSGASEEQTRLAYSTHNAVENITHLADAVKKGATMLGPGQPDQQHAMLDAVRNVAVTLQGMIISAGKIEDQDSQNESLEINKPSKVIPETVQKPTLYSVRERVSDFFRPGRSHRTESLKPDKNISELQRTADETINNVSKLLNTLESVDRQQQKQSQLESVKETHKSSNKQQNIEQIPTSMEAHKSLVQIEEVSQLVTNTSTAKIRQNIGHGSEALLVAEKNCHQMAKELESEISHFRNFENDQIINSYPQISLVSRYLAPEQIAQTITGPISRSIDKAQIVLAQIEESSTGQVIQEDVFDLAYITRNGTNALLHNSKRFLWHGEADGATRISCCQNIKEICYEYSFMLRSLKLAIDANLRQENFDLTGIKKNCSNIARICTQLLAQIHPLKEGPRLVMYFRASSPQWRDVAEKYIGRHVAYHYHQVKDNCSSQCNLTSQQTCVQVPYNISESGILLGSRASEEANIQLTNMLKDLEYRIELGKRLLLCHNDDQKLSKIDQASSLLNLIINIIQSTKDLLKSSSSLVENISFENLTHEQTQLQIDDLCFGRSELTAALACKDLCNVGYTFADSCGLANETSSRMMLKPSPKRIAQAVHEVADGSATLITSVRSCQNLNSINSVAVDYFMNCIRNVKSTTDLLLEKLNEGQFDPTEFEDRAVAFKDTVGRVRIQAP